MLLNNALICLTMHEAEHKITVQANVVLIDAWRYLESCQTSLKWSKKELLAKIIVTWNYFPKTLQFVRQGSKYCRTFEYVRVLNMPRLKKVLNMYEYAFVAT